MDRPQWVRKLNRFIRDDILDEELYGYPMDGRDDHIHEEIEDAVGRILCKHYGHEIEDDQCGIPEHRYCVHCMNLEVLIQEEDDGKVD